MFGDSWSYFTHLSTLSTLACKNFLASSPAQTLSIDQSAERRPELPCWVPSCLRMGRALYHNVSDQIERLKHLENSMRTR